MIQKLLLGVVVACVGSLAIAESNVQAGGCHYGYHGHHAYRAPVVVARPYYTHRAPVYAVPVHRYAYPAYRPYSSYRAGYGGYIGPSISYGSAGYGSFYGRRSYYGYGRSGVAIGIGF